MTQTKKSTPATIVFNQAELDEIDAVASMAINASNTNAEIIERSATFLGTEPTLLRWIGYFETLETVIANSRGVTMGTAKNIVTTIVKGLSDAYDIAKPQSARAVATQEKRLADSQALESKYGKKSIKDLKDMIIATNDSKQLKELTSAIASRNKAVEAESKTVNKDYIKDGLSKINAWIKSENPVDVQVERVTAILNFINKAN